ncbi:unnamed protein product [Sphagnum jensenii]|uniref:Uncharacterized protein n=2 Tax=Sphagnum jensenii TaxID=128206 RepID=A0ABP1A9Z3_9BRYO
MAKIGYRSGGGGFFDTQRQRSLRVHTPQQQQGVPVHFLKPRKEKEALSFSFTIFEEVSVADVYAVVCVVRTIAASVSSAKVHKLAQVFIICHNKGGGEKKFLLVLAPGCPWELEGVEDDDRQGISSWDWNLVGENTPYQALFPLAWTIYGGEPDPDMISTLKAASPGVFFLIQ